MITNEGIKNLFKLSHLYLAPNNGYLTPDINDDDLYKLYQISKVNIFDAKETTEHTKLGMFHKITYTKRSYD